MSRYERPLPPQNLELKHAIEEMAEYIVKYGPKGEEKAMAEHANNPKYAFLFGGPNSDYYQYCLQVNFDRGPPPVENFAQVQQPNHNLNQQELDEIQALTTQLEDMQRQIAQSEMNLKAQEESIPKQKDHEFAKQVTVAEDAKLSGYLVNAKLDIANFFELLNNLNNPKAMKEYIGTCKKWILDNCQTDQQREVILMYLLGRVRNIQSTDSFRLNILYLVNDWAHYCQKKKIDAVTQMLSRYVPKMYAFTVELASDPLVHPKLEKLIGVWEGSKYFTDQCFKQLRNPNHIYTTAMTAITAEYSKIAIDLDMQFQAMFAGYEQQHLNFVRHINQQISQLEGRLMHIRNGNQGQFQAPQSVQRRSRFDQQTRDDMGSSNGFGRFFPPSQRGPPPQDHSWRTEAEGDDIDGVPYNEESLIPNRPYYNLPAALIVPQVPMENLTYKAIEPTNLRMPAIMHPSQRLLDAIEAFYDRPHSMDSHGWEVGSLADFYDRKLRLKKIIEEKLQGEEKTLEDIIDNRMNAEDIKLQGAEKDAQIAKLKEDAKNRANNRRNSRSRSRSRSHSRSHSRSSRSRSRSSSRSKSRSRSRSSRSRSKSVTPPRRPFIRERSPSPVGFARPSFSMPSAPLGGENKGAMLMAKMGWSGKGLGAKEHGIVEPVSGGEVRDRGEMYRGLGSKTDPFEQFRKMRSGNYHDKHQMSTEGRKNQY